MENLPIIDIENLYSNDSDLISEVDKKIAFAAASVGFFVITGYRKKNIVNFEARKKMLTIFDIPMEKQRYLWKKNFAPENKNLYRGWFPLTSSLAKNREGFEMGPDIARDHKDYDTSDILQEKTPRPKSEDIPGDWIKTCKSYYLAMELIGEKLLCSLSRSLGISEHIFLEAFRMGISTLRLLHYPKRDDFSKEIEDTPDRFTIFKGKRYEQIARPHVDSGLLTILAQDNVGGLQVRSHSEGWVEVPLIADSFSVNFGGLMEYWTGGRVKATLHRVLSLNERRYSVPFFFEPRPSTVISNLPIRGSKKFEPFLYGNHLWEKPTKFPENKGLEHLSPPRLMN